MHKTDIHTSGVSPDKAEKALILLHGRGGTAEDILSLASHLHVRDYALFAPQATNNTWYPYSFMAPRKENEPWLSSALQIIEELVDEIIRKGIPAENICFAGFSQGACLTLEFIASRARLWKGVAAFTGGLIGEKIYSENYQGDLSGTPVYIGSSDPDPHVPVSRINETAGVLRKMNANVKLDIYKNMGHTITANEIKEANAFVFT